MLSTPGCQTFYLWRLTRHLFGFTDLFLELTLFTKYLKKMIICSLLCICVFFLKIIIIESFFFKVKQKENSWTSIFFLCTFTSTYKVLNISLNPAWSFFYHLFQPSDLQGNMIHFDKTMWLALSCFGTMPWGKTPLHSAFFSSAGWSFFFILKNILYLVPRLQQIVNYMLLLFSCKNLHQGLYQSGFRIPHSWGNSTSLIKLISCLTFWRSFYGKCRQ